MESKILIKSLGEETIYSAKGHFKACDIRRNLITITIWGCVVFNILGIIGISGNWNICFSVVGLFGTIALLIWNEGEGKDYKHRHKKTAEEYLALHKEARKLFYAQNISESEVEKLNSMIIKLDRSEKLDIPFIARKWAQYAIQNNNETDNWFLQ